MSKRDELSATMAIALAETIEKGGQLIRHQGGWWTEPNASKTGIATRPFEWWVGTSTVEALVRRKRMKYTQWKHGRRGGFPIAAEVIA